MLIFILKLDEPFRNEEIFIIFLFSKVQICGLGSSLQFLVDILPLGSAYFFADPDPGSQNLLDLPDLDSKHWKLGTQGFSEMVIIMCKSH